MPDPTRSGKVGDVQRWQDRGDRALFLGALVILLFGTAGGAWSGASDHTVLASQLARSALAPLYSALAGIAALIPIGEPWFRVGALNALLGAIVLVGVARASRALLPKDPVAGFAAALALALTPSFRDAAGFPGPSMLAACARRKPRLMGVGRGQGERQEPKRSGAGASGSHSR